MKKTIIKIICKGCGLPLFKFNNSKKEHHNKECLKLDRSNERQKYYLDIINRNTKGVK